MRPGFPVFYSDTFLAHDTGPGHPENAGRLEAVVAHLRSRPWADQIRWQSPSNRDPLPAIAAVHDPDYVAALKAFAEGGGGQLDADTVVSPRSYAAAVQAVTAWLDGVDWVYQQRSPAFALVRPPGHHAERDRGMGFCLLSNAAIAAHYALTLPGVSRVAILDWDVHHGNGTQALTEQTAAIFYCSLHQSPAYPGTGAFGEEGFYQNVMNIPLPPGSGWAEYAEPLQTDVLPKLRSLSPDVLLVSAGYDAAAADPLAGMALRPEDYATLTRACLEITPAVLFGLEGGYDYASLSQSVAATIDCCLHVLAG